MAPVLTTPSLRQPLGMHCLPRLPRGWTLMWACCGGKSRVWRGARDASGGGGCRPSCSCWPSVAGTPFATQQLLPELLARRAAEVGEVDYIGPFHKSQKARHQKFPQAAQVPGRFRHPQLRGGAHQHVPAVHFIEAQNTTGTARQNTQTARRIRSCQSIQNESHVRKVHKYQLASSSLPPLGLCFDGEKEQPEEEDAEPKVTACEEMLVDGQDCF